jgi:hypothetical protein
VLRWLTVVGREAVSMPRKRATGESANARATEAAAAPRPKLPHVISKTAVYSMESLRAALGLCKHSVGREIREGRLKACKRCGRYWIIGTDVLAWLQGGAVQARLHRERDGDVLNDQPTARPA